MYAYDIEAATRELSLSKLVKHMTFMDLIQGGDNPEYVQQYADVLGERLENKIELAGVPMRHFKQHCNSRDTVHLMMSRFEQDEIACIPAVQAALREHARCYVWSVLVVTWREYLRQVAKVIADGAAVPAIVRAAQSPVKLFFIACLCKPSAGRMRLTLSRPSTACRSTRSSPNASASWWNW